MILRIGLVLTLVVIFSFAIGCNSETVTDVLEIKGDIIYSETEIERAELFYTPIEAAKGIEADALNEESETEPEELLRPKAKKVEGDVFIEKWEPARIIIPSIDVDLEVIGGVNVLDPKNLAKAPVHFNDLSHLGAPVKGDLPNTKSGNVGIAGHRAGSWNFFLDIDLLQKGDEVYLDIGGYRFIYSVEWQKIVHQTNWSSLRTTSYPALTLMACEPKHIEDTDYRIMVRSVLKEVFLLP